ncbi:MAG: hypothetical protein MUC96_29760 [Myxococcaceae bacterium]|jgi:hypothetical protein|nr:hypothetical protein [Myxococcaceae bacterium]
MQPVDPALEVLAVVATLAGVVITFWVARSGKTTVGKGWTKRTITARANPFLFAFEVLKLALATLVVAGFTAWLLFVR